jgi:hypothetical protein
LHFLKRRTKPFSKLQRIAIRELLGELDLWSLEFRSHSGLWCDTCLVGTDGGYLPEEKMGMTAREIGLSLELTGHS